jgi:hypothetical protein
VDHRGTVCLPGRVRGQAREAVDGRTELKRLRRAAARGERNSGRGAVGVDGARAEEQEERVGSLLVQGIGMGRCGEGEVQRGAAAVVRVVLGKNTEQTKWGRRGCGSVGSIASSQKRGRHWEKERITAGLWIATAR